MLFVVVLSTGCFGGSLGGNGSTRPGVMPKLSELSGDASHRDAVLDSSNQTAGPEHRKGMTVKERKVETGAATVAAIVGSLFSKTKNVTIGTATTFDENTLIAPRTMPVAPVAPPHVPTGDDTPVEPPGVPWIKLR